MKTRPRQFLITVNLTRFSGTPPEKLQAEMTALIEDETRRGTFVVTGGLAPHSDGARLSLSSGGMERGAAQLPLHGFAIVEAQSLDKAIAVASRMLHIHKQYVPNWQCDWEVRPIVTHCLP